MTQTRSATLRTMVRSWVISSIAMPRRSCRSLQQAQDLRLDRDVERGRGLVGDQQLGLVGERHGDHHPLALPAGELMRIGIEALLGIPQAHQVQQLEGLSPRLGLAEAAMQDQRLADLARDRVQRVERGHRLLEDDADAAASHLAQRALVGAQQVAPAEADAAARMPGLRVGQQLQDRQRRDRLARAALAHERQGLALLDPERHVAHGSNRAALDLEAHREVVDLEQAHGTLIGTSCGGRRHRAPPRR